MLKIKFWGTRGSIPVSGEKNLKYGGNTPCIEVRTDQNQLLIIDCGSGIRELGYKLMEDGFNQGGQQAVILLSHCHWDHIQGMPFFRPAYIPGNHFDIYGLRSFYSTLESALAGQMQHPYFPNSFFDMGATFKIHEMPECKFNLADLSITTAYMNHPDETFGFRLDYKGRSFVYASDNEHTPYDEPDKKLINFARDADVLVHDTQFTLEEYLNGRMGWGHSVPEVSVRSAQLCGTRHLLLFHHDPSHDDAFIDQMVAHCHDLNNSHYDLTIEGARDFMEIQLD